MERERYLNGTIRWDDLTNPLDQRSFRELEARQKSSKLRRLTRFPLDSVDLSSNDFLSLSTSWLLRREYLQELKRGGICDEKLSGGIEYDNSAKFVKNHLGSGGSRLLDGNSEFAENLESSIAQFHKAPAGVLFTSGFDANTGVFSSLPHQGDVVIHDELIHASVREGLRLSRVRQTNLIAFRHNDIRHLKWLLDNVEKSDCAVEFVFVAVESVYSMDGDVAPLQKIIDCLRSSPWKQKKVQLIVDEAHATGVLGKNGRGLVCQLGLEKSVAIRVHTFGKALACNGAIVLCSEIMKMYLLNYARSLVYTTSISFPGLAAIRASYSLLESGLTDHLAATLKGLMRSFSGMLYRLMMKRKLQINAGEFDITNNSPRGLLHVETFPVQTPIVAIRSTKAQSLAQFCQAQKLMIRAVMPPTVPKGESRVRVCLHANNTLEQIESVVHAFEVWLIRHKGSLTINFPGKPILNSYSDNTLTDRVKL